MSLLSLATSLLCRNHILHNKAPVRFTFVINHRKYYHSCIINLSLSHSLYRCCCCCCGMSGPSLRRSFYYLMMFCGCIFSCLLLFDSSSFKSVYEKLLISDGSCYNQPAVALVSEFYGAALWWKVH